MSASRRRCRIDLIVGTRPNIVKLGPLSHALADVAWCDPRVVFLEQHTTDELANHILDDLGVDAAHVLRIPLKNESQGQRFGEMVAGYASALQADAPDLTVVFGDVDTTLAAAMAAKRHGIEVAHVEAGLRSFDRRMPEELNRLMTDAISDLFFATSEDAIDTLVRVEGKPADAVHFVGNLMIDAVVRTLDRDAGLRLCERLGLAPGAFAIATFHRPSNVDNADTLREMIALLRDAAARVPMLFPMHPRTAAALERHGLADALREVPGLVVSKPVRYRDFINLLACARVALTDSGGLQEETSFLGVPCLTLRENTERPVTVALGTNRLVRHGEAIAALESLLAQPAPARPAIPLWDGRTAGRIVDALQAWWSDRAPA